MIANVQILARRRVGSVRFNWHNTSVRYNHTDHFVGTSFYTLDVTGPSPIIKEKKVCAEDRLHPPCDRRHHV
jgi:benzoate/toluate 1,2-dioxygenase beta subunit